MDMKKLLEEWKDFNLMEKEKENYIVLNQDEIKDIEDQIEGCLIGKVLANKNISAVAIKNAMTGARKTRNKFIIETIGKNIFLFKFEKQTDRDWIMGNGSWLFNKHLLILEELVVNQRISEVEFKEVAFWLRLINLPIGFRNRLATKKIGRNLGTFLEFDEVKNEFN